MKEETPLAPVHTYAVSKVATHFLGQAYYQTYQVPVIEVRPFNHIGPRQRTGFVVPDFASQVAAIIAGEDEPVIRVGNLRPRRDFTDVRDVARAYELLAERGEAGSGIPCLLRAGPMQFRRSWMACWPSATSRSGLETDPKRMRPSKMPVLLGSAERLIERTGWAPQIPLAQTLADTLAYWDGMIKTTRTGQ